MMDRKKKLLAGLALAAFAALVVWAVMTVPQKPQLPEQTADSNLMTYEGNTISEEKDGRKIWDLTTEHIEMDVHTKDVRLENLTGHFYMQDGRVVEVHADHGRYENETKDISLSGNVAISTSDGAILSSRELQWVSADEMLAAVGDASVSKEDMKASGERIESTDGFNKIRIIGRAHLVKGGESK